MAMQYLTPEETAALLKVKEATLANWRTRGEGPAYAKFGRLVRYPDYEIERFARESVQATHLGLDNFRGKWRYRFKVRGQPYGEVTDLEAVPENILKAQALKEAHRADIIKGKAVVRQMRMPIDKAVAEFNLWYRSEHPRGGKCKWATSLMSSFQFYLEHLRLPLDKLTPDELERFKMWRRENDIHDNTLHKQMLLIQSFCTYGRKNGWIKGDPFAKGEDIEVKIRVNRSPQPCGSCHSRKRPDTSMPQSWKVSTFLMLPQS